MLKNIIILLLISVFSSQLHAEIIVIGNLENNIPTMTKKKVQEFFMGRTRFFSNGVRAVPIDASDLRKGFYQKLTHRPIEQINAYWARLTFSGHSTPPSKMPDQQAVIIAVKKGKGAISYINRDKMNESQVKPLYIFE